MVKLEDAVIARYEKHGERFEILIDPDAAQNIKEGKDIDIFQDLVVDKIFKDSNKGERASEEKIQEIFGTLDVEKIAMKIVLDGHIQLTTEQRRKIQEQKRKQIIATIARNAINPQTKTPHPPQRIEMALQEAKIHIDPFKSTDEQVQEIVEKLRPIIPIRMEKIVVAVKLLPQDVGKTYGDIKAFGKITKEEWQKDGVWIGLVEIPAGLQIEFYERLNEKTKGSVETKIIK